MEPCNYSSQVERFHDGELDAVAAAEVWAHVATCSRCAALLTELQATSAWFGGARRRELSPIGLHRLHRRLSAETDRGLVRLAGAFSGIAAGVMLLGSAWLLRMPGTTHRAEVQSPQTPPPWVGVAVSLDTDKLASDVGTPAAQWYLADASHGSDELP